MSTCSTLPACAVLTELGDWDGVKMIADTNYAGLPSKKQSNFAWWRSNPAEVSVSLLVDIWILAPWSTWTSNLPMANRSSHMGLEMRLCWSTSLKKYPLYIWARFTEGDTCTQVIHRCTDPERFTWCSKSGEGIAIRLTLTEKPLIAR